MGILILRTSVVEEPPGDNVLFAHDYSAGAYPNGGWGGNYADNVAMTRTRVAGGGPTGQDSVRFVENYYNGEVDGGGTIYGGDFHCGNSASGLFTFPTWGQVITYRGWWKFSAGTDFDGLDQNTGEAGSIWRIKAAIIGNNSGVSDSRIIPGFEGYPVAGGGILWYYYVGIDDNITRSSAQTIMGAWFKFQVACRYSSALNVADGYVRIYIDGALEAEQTGVVLNQPDTSNVVQSYVNNGIANGTQCEWEHAETAFESAYNASY